MEERPRKLRLSLHRKESFPDDQSKTEYLNMLKGVRQFLGEMHQRKESALLTNGMVSAFPGTCARYVHVCSTTTISSSAEIDEQLVLEGPLSFCWVRRGVELRAARLVYEKRCFDCVRMTNVHNERLDLKRHALFSCLIDQALVIPLFPRRSLEPTVERFGV